MFKALTKFKSRIGFMALAMCVSMSSVAHAVLSAEETAAIAAVDLKLTDLLGGVMPLIGTALGVGIGIALFIKYVGKVKTAA